MTKLDYYKGVINPYYLPGLIKDYRIAIKPKWDKDCLDGILHVVSMETGIGVDEIISKCRKRHIVVARQLYFKMCKQYTSSTFKAIGDSIFRDHTTVLFGIKSIGYQIEQDKDVQNLCRRIEMRII
jgi:chromosomal replication initiation ATPase DnaA